jgi:hypothetical protein
VQGSTTTSNEIDVIQNLILSEKQVTPTPTSSLSLSSSNESQQQPTTPRSTLNSPFKSNEYPNNQTNNNNNKHLTDYLNTINNMNTNTNSTKPLEETLATNEEETHRLDQNNSQLVNDAYLTNKNDTNSNDVSDNSSDFSTELSQSQIDKLANISNTTSSSSNVSTHEEEEENDQETDTVNSSDDNVTSSVSEHDNEAFEHITTTTPATAATIKGLDTNDGRMNFKACTTVFKNPARSKQNIEEDHQ